MINSAEGKMTQRYNEERRVIWGYAAKQIFQLVFADWWFECAENFYIRNK